MCENSLAFALLSPLTPAAATRRHWTQIRASTDGFIAGNTVRESLKESGFEASPNEDPNLFLLIVGLAAIPRRSRAFYRAEQNDKKEKGREREIFFFIVRFCSSKDKEEKIAPT